MKKFLVGLLVVAVLAVGVARIGRPIEPMDGKPMLSDGKPMLSDDGRRA